jgi:hypothetical protein
VEQLCWINAVFWATSPSVNSAKNRPFLRPEGGNSQLRTNRENRHKLLGQLSKMNIFKYTLGKLGLLVLICFSVVTFLVGFWGGVRYSCTFANRILIRQLSERDPPVLDIPKAIAFVSVQERRNDESFFFIAMIIVSLLMVFLIICLIRKLAIQASRRE